MAQLEDSHVLSDPSKTLKLFLVPGHGLTFHRLLAHGYDVLVGPEDVSLLKTEGRKFNNQVVGRYANRLPAGELQVADPNNASTRITMNLEEASPGVYLHGGSSGFDLQTWKQIPRQETLLFERDIRPESAPPEDGEEAIFQYISRKGDQGFPEDVLVEAYITVTAPCSGSPNSLGQVYYNIRTQIVEIDEDGKIQALSTTNHGPTPINMTVHWGFNLEQGQYVDKSLLSIDSTAINELDPKTSMATGGIKDIYETAHDFSSPRAIGAGMPENGYDDNFLLDKERVKARSDIVNLGSLSNPISLSFSTNQSSVMCYTAGGDDGSGTRKAIHGKVDQGYQKFQTVFLEFQHPVGTLLHSKLQEHAGADTLLRPGEIYENWVTLVVKDSRL